MLVLFRQGSSIVLEFQIILFVLLIMIGELRQNRVRDCFPNDQEEDLVKSDTICGLQAGWQLQDYRTRFVNFFLYDY